MAYNPKSKKGRSSENPISGLINNLTANKKIDDINNLASISNQNDVRLSEAESSIVDIEQGIVLINNELDTKEPLLPSKTGNANKFLKVSADESEFEYDVAGGGFSGTMDDIPDGPTYVKTENNYTDADALKLAGIAAGAEVNVNADWSASSGDAQILNKPVIPTALSDLTEDSTHRVVTDAEKSTWNGKQNALGFTPVDKAGDTMSGSLTLNADPITSLGAATKQYVDNLAAGINFHTPCHVATTGNLSAAYSNGTSGVGATLTSSVNVVLVIDSHSLSVGERVLVWQQSSGLQNGIYVVTDIGSVSTPWILTRATDADNSPSGELQNGDFTFIQQGATYGGFGFILNTTGTITVGVTSINYVQFNTAQAVAAGYGLQELSPNVISIDTSIVSTGGGTASGTNTGDETNTTIKTKLGASSASNDGYLSSLDWITFNGKQDALVSATNIKTINGSSVLGSGDLVVSGSDPLGFTSIIKSANQDVTNSATFTDDTELQFSVVAGGMYLVEMQLVYSGNNTTGDYKWQFLVTSGIISGRGNYLGLTTGSSIGTFPVSSVGTNAIIPVSLGVVQADLTQPILCTIYYPFTVSADATFKFQFANNSAAAGRTSRTIKGTYLKYKKIN